MIQSLMTSARSSFKCFVHPPFDTNLKVLHLINNIDMLKHTITNVGMYVHMELLYQPIEDVQNLLNWSYRIYSHEYPWDGHTLS